MNIILIFQIPKCHGNVDDILSTLLDRHKKNQAVMSNCDEFVNNLCGSTCRSVRQFDSKTNRTFTKPLCLMKHIPKVTPKVVKSSSLKSPTKPVHSNTEIVLDGNGIFSVRKKRKVSFHSIERFVFESLRHGRRYKRTYTDRDLEISLHKNSFCRRVPNIVFLSISLVNPIIGLASLLVRNYMENKNSMDGFSGSLRLNSDKLLLLHHMGRRRMSFVQARFECQRRGLRLPVPKDEIEHNIYSSFVHLNGDLWYGISDQNREGTWESVYEPNATLYLNWAKNQPDDYRDGEDFVKARCDLHINDVPSDHSLAVLCVREVNIKASEVEQTRFTPDAFLASVSLGECPAFDSVHSPSPNKLTPGLSCDSIYLKVVRRKNESSDSSNCKFFPNPINGFQCKSWETPLIIQDLHHARNIYKAHEFLSHNFTFCNNLHHKRLFHELENSLKMNYTDYIAYESVLPCLSHHVTIAKNFSDLISETERPDESLLIFSLETLNRCYLGPLTKFRQHLAYTMVHEIADLCHLNSTKKAISRLPDLIFPPSNQVDGVVENIMLYRYMTIARSELAMNQFKTQTEDFDLQRSAQISLISKLGAHVTIDKAVNLETARSISRGYKSLDFTQLATIFTSSMENNEGILKR